MTTAGQSVTEASESDRFLGTLPGGTQVYAAGQATAKHQLITPDEYLCNQSRFDRQARASIGGGIVDDATLESLYLSYVSNQVQEWQTSEVAQLTTIISSMNLQYHLLADFTLPAVIFLVKTSGKEEGYAAYTRQLNTIVLPANMVASLKTSNGYGDPLHPAVNTAYLQSIVCHESFHIFSKNTYQKNKPRLAKLYGEVGFHYTDNDIVLPDVNWPHADSAERMADLVITNPDSPVLNTFIKMATPNSPENPVPLMPLLIATGPYQGGEFFQYLSWYVMRIEQDAQGHWQPLLDSEGRPEVYSMSASSNETMMATYLAQVGYNLSGEIFQADEVLAQNFVLLINNNVPSQHLLTQMEAIFNNEET